MNRLLFPVIMFLFIFIQLNCNKSDSLSNIPKIEYIGMDKLQMIQGDINVDSIWLQFKFEDGDGDLGYGSGDTTKDIVVMDSRTGNIQDSYKIPDLPPSENDTQKGILTIKIFTTCCLFPDGTPPCENPIKYPVDSLQYLLYIRDKAGNKSNIIQSDYVKLFCH